MWLCDVCLIHISLNINNQHTKMTPIPTKKIFLTLSSRATIINAIVIMIIGTVFWGFKIIEQFPIGTDLKKVEFNIVDNVPFYYDCPFTAFSMFLYFVWLSNIFELKPDDYSWRSFKCRFIPLILGSFIVQTISKFIILFILIKLK